MKQSFLINVLSRLLLIIAVAIGIGWAFFDANQSIVGIVLSLALVILLFNVLHYQNRINERINYFFEAVKNEDFSLAFPAYKNDKIIQELNTHLADVNKKIQQIQMKNYQQEQYFRALIEHVGIGILSYDENGFVVHANSALKKLLGLGQFTHLKQLEKVDNKLAQILPQIQENGQRLISFNNKQGKVNVSIKATTFLNKNKPTTLLSVQDINKELDEKELDSWMRLIRVLTHEIMNSIAPVTSLSESLSNFFTKEGQPISPDQINEKMINTTIRGLEVIKEQGNGLITFVESYRKLTRLPKPEKKLIPVGNLLEKTALLRRSNLTDNKIRINVNTQKNKLLLLADEKLISQVLINLVKNAVEALEGQEKGVIELSGRENQNGEVEILVRDNGPGISPELIDEIFVPFFTTRESGSGIGLSLSRQIMRMHGGSLKVNSIPQKETCFILQFS
ncbi:ATP-binding protein [uncultured Sunxiuqinia sp.]|uniref:sensor histidine kinase n=1 Tax=uncultured Sunxiuqinia sp. TaxID=1573825 RepID=UPI002AA727F3|nr:ATP-binding protein [uncultured Sunxiuqinia sp.]